MAQRRSLPAVCVLAGTRLAAGQAPADGQGAPRGPAWAPCWEKYTREECCGPDGGQRRASCFDSVFTARECCAGDGWARLSPEAEPTETAWEDAARWLQGGLLTEPPRGHPAYSRAQRRWEAGIANATVLLAEEVLGHRVQLRVFKRSGPALAKMLEASAASDTNLSPSPLGHDIPSPLVGAGRGGEARRRRPSQKAAGLLKSSRAL
ncbi:unnamed protein product [Prorocentrum cordatum]|uniref:Uncharacterized protein n=1 Tax=Prorocentrum cordatum TaxID=2364126 RepID=A0ABN9XK41_9DINO|nr:unnamed protein product [Polarella glacialis]